MTQSYSEKVSITLTGESNWLEWYALVKRLAEQYNLWAYIDPDGEGKALEKPEEPTPAKVKLNATELTQLDSTQMALYSQLYSGWREEMKRWEKSKAQIEAIHTAILAATAPNIIKVVARKRSCYELLKALKNWLGPTDEELRNQLKNEYDAAFKTPSPRNRQPKQIIKWVEKLQEIKMLCEEAGVDRVKDSKEPVYTFLLAIRPLSESFYDQWQPRVEDGEKVEFDKLTNRFKKKYTQDSRTESKESSIEATFATYKGDSNGATNTNKNTDFKASDATEKGKGRERKRREPLPESKQCILCFHSTYEHPPERCRYAVPSLRPEGWKAHPGIMATVERTLASNPELRDIVDRANKTSSTPASTSTATPRSFLTISSGPTKIASFNVSRDYALKKSVVLDSASDIHVCNEYSERHNFREAKPDDWLLVGDTYSKIVGFVDYTIQATNMIGERFPIVIKDARYVPGFHTNLVSSNLTKKAGVFYNQRLEILEESDQTPVCRVETHHGLPTLQYIPLNEEDNAVFATRTSIKERVLIGSEADWHNRYGHLHGEAVRHLPEAVNGVKIDEGKATIPKICDTCQLAKASRQISRRPVERTVDRWERTHLDLIPFNEGYNGDQWALHFLCDSTRFHIIMTFRKKSDSIEALRYFFRLIKKVWKAGVVYIHMDNEQTLLPTVNAIIQDEGIILEPTVAATPEQNGSIERSGGVITQRARALILQANLPKPLWPLATRAAVYILNRTPARQLDGSWKTPYELMYGRKPTVENLYQFGSLAYCRIDGILRKDKMAPRASIGYLVGYEASNIWKVWSPKKGSIFRVRDVVFDEKIRYEKEQPFVEDLPESIPDPQPALLQPFILPQIDEIEEFESSESIPESTVENVETNDNTTPAVESAAAHESASILPPVTDKFDITRGLPTPEGTPEPSYQNDHSELLASSATNSQHLDQSNNQVEEPVQHELTDHTALFEVDDQALLDRQLTVENEAYELPPEPPPLPPTRLSREIKSDVLEENIIRQPRANRGKRKEDPQYVSYFTTSENNLTDYYAVFHAATDKIGRLHRDDLPPEPETWPAMKRHPYRDNWLLACGTEVEGQYSMGTAQVIDRPRDVEILPLKWVFKYKFDEEGYLERFKARICVRGDLQRLDEEDKRATTLAARTNRVMIAIAAAFDLDMTQIDIVMAFLYSKLEKAVYTELPDGFKKEGKVWLLLRALYGLREAPRLWQKELSRTLAKLGLQPVPEDPCLYSNDHLIIMYFVDDLIIFNKPTPEGRDHAFKVRKALATHYEVRDLGEAKWFLGVRIVRDRANKKIWLSQDSYIEKITRRFHLVGDSHPNTPMAAEALEPHTGQATPSQIRHFQQLVGSIIYASIITRLDVAKCGSKLAEHLTNPSKAHIAAAERVIKYLYNTRFYAIEYSDSVGDSVLFCASDAAFGDYKDRKSSEGYIFKLFGGPVDWRASKQKTVTTSTTEAELLALSEAGKQTYWWNRLFKMIDFDPEEPITVHCDNRQTIDLIMNPEPRLRTKLRHVDIHHCWLRQEAQAGRIHIQWLPTAEMPADGLTKLLAPQNHGKFVKMIGLADLKSLNLS